MNNPILIIDVPYNINESRLPIIIKSILFPMIIGGNMNPMAHPI